MVLLDVMLADDLVGDSAVLTVELWVPEAVVLMGCWMVAYLVAAMDVQKVVNMVVE